MPQEDSTKRPGRVSQRTHDCLLSFSSSHENGSTSSLTNCFAGAERNLNSLRHWRETYFGRRDQVVRGRRAGGQVAEAGRLLARGICGWNSAAEADAGDWFGAI